VLVAVLAAGAGAWWLDRQRAEQRQAVEVAFAEADRLQAQARWGEARAVLDQAAQHLGDSGPGDLRGRLKRMRSALDLVARLDTIRLRGAVLIEGRFDIRGTDRDYEAAFREAGMVAVGGDAAVAASWVGGSGARDALVAALDDWAFCAGEPQRRSWLLEVARQADPDPWRDRARDPAVWNDRATLVRLTEEAEAAKQSPYLLGVLGHRLDALGVNPVPLLRAAQERLPGDFWVNYALGSALARGKKAEEAVGFLRAALALRPRTTAVHNDLGIALYLRGQLGEAAAEYRKAIALDPKFATPHNNLGNLLCDQGKWDEAAAEHREAIALDPKFAMPHYNLGNVLGARGQLGEAAAEYRTAIALDPKLAAPHNNLGNVLVKQGKLGEAAAGYRTAIALDPKLAAPHSGLGDVLRAWGKLGEAAAEFRTAIALDPKLAVPHVGLGNVLRASGKLEEAAAECRTAIALDAKDALPHIGLGNVLRAWGKLEEAAGDYREAIRLKPDSPEAHCSLGLALRDQGQFAEALAALKYGHKLGSRNPHWRYPSAQDVQQCERLLKLDRRLPAMLNRQEQPADAAERIDLAWICQLPRKKCYAAAVHFYDEAFAIEPERAGNRPSDARYNAACAAVLAGCGQGKDAEKLDAKARVRLRQRALDWLRAELAAWRNSLEQDRSKAASVRGQLQHWLNDPDFAGVRGPAALGKLPETECAAWTRLWADVQALLERAGGKNTNEK
jgi:eukaryotic-like serine/threonine-protein kinase